MRLRLGSWAFLVSFLLIGSMHVAAAEVLAYVPQDALSFAIVRDAQQSNEKISKLLGIFAEAVPAPLDMAQAMTGLSQGLNLEGDVLFALLPVADPAGVPAPMFLLPVSDYTKFADSIKADTTGEICRVTIAEEDILVAKHEDYALLMNVEHRELMLRVLGSEIGVPVAVAAHQDWLSGNDVSTMVTAAGIAYVKKAAEVQLQAPAVSPGADPFAEPPIAGDMLRMGDSLPFAELFTRDVEMAGFGLAIDEAINSRVRWTVKFAEESAASATTNSEANPLIGFEDKPYALAGGGDLPAEFVAMLPEVFTGLSRETAAQDGREDFTEQDWADVRKSYELWTSGLKGLSLLLNPDAEGEPLLSVLFARLTVNESKAYLESLEKSFELSNQLAARSKSDIKLNFEASPTKIAGAEGMEVTCDLGKATGDGDMHIWQALLTSVLGIDHKLSLYFCATDGHHVFFAMESQEKFVTFIEAYRKQDMGLVGNAQVKKTVALMEEDAPWTCLVDPQGLVELVRTAMKSMQILGFVPEFPLYPTAPPLGLTLSADKTTWQGELVMSVEAARAMALFTKEVEAAFR
jgi:hypothetical protein